MSALENPLIVLAQTNPSLGNLHANLQEHRARVHDAVGAGADIILFPELSLTGYFLKDQTPELSCAEGSDVLVELQALSKDVSIGAGFVERSRDGRYYNAYGFFEGGELVHVHRKVHLVAYGMFEESRDFAAGERYAAFESRHGRFGVLLCEDLWHLPAAYVLFLQGVDAILVPSAGPARGVEAGAEGLGSQHVWNSLLHAVSLFTQTWMVYVNRVGWEDGVGFAGGSRVVSPSGATVLEVPGLEPATGEVRLDASALRRARVSSPMLRDEKPWLLAAELARVRPELGQRLGGPIVGGTAPESKKPTS